MANKRLIQLSTKLNTNITLSLKGTPLIIYKEYSICYFGRTKSFGIWNMKDRSKCIGRFTDIEALYKRVTNQDAKNVYLS